MTKKKIQQRLLDLLHGAARCDIRGVDSQLSIYGLEVADVGRWLEAVESAFGADDEGNRFEGRDWAKIDRTIFHADTVAELAEYIFDKLKDD